MSNPFSFNLTFLAIQFSSFRLWNYTIYSRSLHNKWL